MTVLLPHFRDARAFGAWRAQPAGWMPVALDIARAAGLPADDVMPFETGTNLVLGLGPSLILKIFPPLLRGQFLAERASLRQLAGTLPLPIPKLVAEGERDGWPWLAMTRLHGVLGSKAWPSLSEPDKERTLQQIGAVIAAVQAVPPGPLARLGPRWPDIVAVQVERCRERQVRLGLPAR
jgi:hygromycin-B 7''-O-kinase